MRGAARRVRGAPGEAALYGLIALLVLFMQAGMAAHFLALLSALGWDSAAAVAMATMLGVGQVIGRVYMVLHGFRFNVLWMNVLPASLLLLAFLLYFLAAGSALADGAFAFLFGAGNGISTITRGALPVALFGPGGYGARVGRILRPAFFASAAAPMAFAWSIGQWGAVGTVGGNAALAAVLLAASALLAHLSKQR